MQEPLKYNHVNWIDGMKINKSHFIALEDACKDQIKDAIACGLNENNYGLLPSINDRSNPLKILISLDNQKTLRVKVFECRAITPGGARIEIFENTADTQGFALPIPENTYELAGNDQDNLFYISLSVNPFARIPMGHADPSEEPPRYPSIMPSYKIHITPGDQMTKKDLGPYFLLIGKIRIVDQKPELIREYIPPCTTVRSFETLARIHAEFDKFLGQLELDLLKILKKINDKEQSNILARVVAHISENILYFLSTGILDFRWRIIDQPPLAMFEYIARLARLIRNTIELNSGEAKEELLNYFTDWCNLKQGEFEKALISTINFRYEHTNGYDTAFQMIQFSEVIATLFSKLSVLEYIGKKKDTNIFVKEQTGKKSFLAD
ncbi:MAG: hypothetical protein NTX61_15800 [Bacteroidetes bacterium]|nr:hypothetical protein [Bacteroidota bacterium]